MRRVTPGGTWHPASSTTGAASPPPTWCVTRLRCSTKACAA
jgi:hypothetical protein